MVGGLLVLIVFSLSSEMMLQLFAMVQICYFHPKVYVLTSGYAKISVSEILKISRHDPHQTKRSNQSTTGKVRDVLVQPIWDPFETRRLEICFLFQS